MVKRRKYSRRIESVIQKNRISNPESRTAQAVSPTDSVKIKNLSLGPNNASLIEKVRKEGDYNNEISREYEPKKGIKTGVGIVSRRRKTR